MSNTKKLPKVVQQYLDLLPTLSSDKLDEVLEQYQTEREMMHALEMEWCVLTRYGSTRLRRMLFEITGDKQYL